MKLCVVFLGPVKHLVFTTIKLNQISYASQRQLPEDLFHLEQHSSLMTLLQLLTTKFFPPVSQIARASLRHATKKQLSVFVSQLISKRLNKNIEVLREFLNFLKLYSNKINTRQFGLLAAIELPRKLNQATFLDNGLHLILNDKTLILSPSLSFPTPELKKT